MNIHTYIYNTIEILSCAIIRSSIVYISRALCCTRVGFIPVFDV